MEMDSPALRLGTSAVLQSLQADRGPRAGSEALQGDRGSCARNEGLQAACLPAFSNSLSPSDVHELLDAGKPDVGGNSTGHMRLSVVAGPSAAFEDGAQLGVKGSANEGRASDSRQAVRGSSSGALTME
jgi:hypothetical protein